MNKPWAGAARKATLDDFNAAAELIGPNVEPDVVLAIWKVESAGKSFRADGTVERRFEPHRMPGVKSTWRDSLKLSPSAREAAFDAAYATKPEAALRATSWGGPQIMGENANAAGFGSARLMVEAFANDEAAQITAFARLIRSWNLAPALRAHDWLVFARRYNGTGQPEVYARKIEAAYRAVSGRASPAVLRTGDRGDAVARLQEALGVTADGAFGPGTDAAVRSYQADNGLPVDGVVGERTWRSLTARRGAQPARQPVGTDALVSTVEKGAGLATVAAGGVSAVRQALPDDAFTLIVYAALAAAAVYIVARAIRKVRA